MVQNRPHISLVPFPFPFPCYSISVRTEITVVLHVPFLQVHESENNQVGGRVSPSLIHPRTGRQNLEELAQTFHTPSILGSQPYATGEVLLE